MADIENKQVTMDLTDNLKKYEDLIEAVERDLGSINVRQQVDLLMDNCSEIPARGYALDIVLKLRRRVS